MGSYDVSCQISGLSIGWRDQAYYILLLPETIMVCSMDDIYELDEFKYYSTGHHTYSDSLFKPFGLPILGTYDTYGKLETIQKNANTQRIESLFGIAIEDIVAISAVSNQYGGSRRSELWEKTEALEGKTKQNFSSLQKTSGMFVHKDIYEHLANYPIENSWVLRKLESFNQAYDRLKQALIEYDTPQPGRRPLSFDDPMEGDRPPKTENDYHLGHLLGRNQTFKTLFRPLIKRGKLKQEICDFLQFDANMRACNRFYMPGVTGQENNEKVNAALYKAALGVLGRKIAYYAEENITEEEICKFCNKSKTQYVENACKECHLEYCGW